MRASQYKRLEAAREKVRLAKKALEKVRAEMFLPGSAIDWEKGGHMQRGTVIESRRDGWLVLNTKTGREVQVSTYDAMRIVDGSIVDA